MKTESSRKEVLIAGYSISAMSRISHLIVGLKDEAGVGYFGITDKGFERDELQSKLLLLLKPLGIEKSPLHNHIESKAWISWVKPVLVCEVKMSEINEKSFDHLEFLWLREDKNITEHLEKLD